MKAFFIIPLVIVGCLLWLAIRRFNGLQTSLAGVNGQLTSLDERLSKIQEKLNQVTNPKEPNN